MNNAQSAIDSCPYLHLASITEPEEGGLRLLVQEARAELTNLDMLTKELLPEVGALLASTTPIQHTTGCQVFEIHWPDYIAYAVENESYARGQPRNLEAKGRQFRLYQKSAYLDYLSIVSFASPEYPGAYKHWAVYCLDHVINVASTSEPSIKTA
jgi:hypothetical protein